MSNKKTGDFGEFIAALYLKLKGYKILKQNFRVQGGEIDIIAEKRGVIAIVEVKTRKDLSYGDPREAVNYYKRKNIVFATKCFLKMNSSEGRRIRFDVIEIILKKLRINHIKDAFFHDDV